MIDQSQQQSPRLFNPNEHLLKLKTGGKTQDYLPVQWRLVWFRAVCPEGTIETEMLHLDLDRETTDELSVWNNDKHGYEKVTKRANGIAIFKATVRDGRDGVATGTKSEKAASFPDFIEKAETGAIGRALAALGYGTQFAPELDEAHRIVDAPVEQTSQPQQNPTHGGNQAQQHNAANTTPTQITEQQQASIRKLCEHLGKAEPSDLYQMSFIDAKTLIQQLTAEYRDVRAARVTPPQQQQTTQEQAARKPSGPLPAPTQEQPDAALTAMIGKAKGRALKLGVAKNATEWEAVLDHLKIITVNTVADIGKINEYLNRLEANQTTKA